MDLDSYKAHLSQISGRWCSVLERNQCAAALVHAGSNGYFYADDQQPPFHPNPYFLQWIPFAGCEHAVLLFVPNQKTQLYWYKPKDYWYLPAEIPDWISDHFAVREYTNLVTLKSEVANATTTLGHCAYVGPNSDSWVSSTEGLENSANVVSQLDYLRAYKTDFELDCMRGATHQAIRGHVAAEGVFRSGGSEFDIHHTYLIASGQIEAELPYPNIVGLNSHAATLHYQHYDRAVPSVHHSLLIDAGANFHGYHSDVTRTYSARGDDEFGELIAAMDAKQQQIVDRVRIGKSFVDLHVDAHHSICELLIETGVVSCSAEAAYDQKLSDVFYPHGTGHLLGIQTHDVGGKTLDTDGMIGESPERFPSLRLLREIENDIVFTVEPGIYFIPVLLDSIRNHADVNWDKVNRMLPFGGIRIEDNVVVLDGLTTNLTRHAFAQAQDIT